MMGNDLLRDPVSCSNSLISVQKYLIYFFAVIIPWQFYFRVYGPIDLPLSLFIVCTGLAITPFININWSAACHNLKGIFFSYSLIPAGFVAASFLYSSGSLHEIANVAGHVAVGLSVILWTGLVLNYHEDIELQKENILKAFIFSAFPLGLAGVVFLIFPELESTWLAMIGGVLIEADSASDPNSNILNVDRIAVIFMDANAASIFWGVSMWSALWLRQRATGLYRASYTIVTTVFCIDIFSTGSRAGIVALILTLLILGIMKFVFSQNNRRRLTVTIGILVLCVPLILVLLKYTPWKPLVIGNMLDRIELLINFDLLTSDSDRIVMLKKSFEAISLKPILGHGVIAFESLGFPKGFPPHNMILQTWIYGGLPSVLGMIWLFSTVLSRLFQKMKTDHEMWLPILVISWLMIQSMLMNLIIGNIRISMLVWLIVAFFLWSPQCSENNERQEC